MSQPTARELASLIGRSGTIRHPSGLTFRATVHDARQAYGRVQVFVRSDSEPGTEAWIDAATISLAEGGAHV